MTGTKAGGESRSTRRFGCKAGPLRRRRGRLRLKNIGQLIMQRAKIQGFLVLDYGEHFEEAINHLAGMLGEGKLQVRMAWD